MADDGWLPEAKPQPKPDGPRPWRSFRGMIAEFAKLRGRLPRGFDHVYAETLREYDVSHANEFKDSDVAIACFHQLQARVIALETAGRDMEAMPPEDFDSYPDPETAA